MKKLQKQLIDLWLEVDEQSESNPAMRIVSDRLERICELLLPPFSMNPPHPPIEQPIEHERGTA